jgi:hypothetical protein
VSSYPLDHGSLESRFGVEPNIGSFADCPPHR